MNDLLLPAFVTVVGAATPLIYAALGELVVEKAGVLNLGVEGMMLIGAIAGFVVGVTTESLILAVLAAAFAGAFMAGLFGLLTQVFLSNQVATGLALTLFGVGASSLLGEPWVGQTLVNLTPAGIPVLQDIPVIGAWLFSHDVLVYVALLAVVLVWWFLGKTRRGLELQAVGESHDVAHSLGLSVVTIRFLAILFGGAMAGTGGAYLSLVATPMWAENMTAGRGWIALALVVFASWRPWRIIVGAYLFGGVTIAQLHAQASGLDFPSQLLSMLPYIATIVVLVLISSGRTRFRTTAPASLGQIFYSPR